MSAGSPRIIIRLSPAEIADVKTYLAKRLENPTALPWSISDFIRSAIKEKLRHVKYRKPKKLKIGLPPDEEDQVGYGPLPTSEDPDSGINIVGD